MYRAPGWRRHALVRDADRRRGRQARHDDRGPVAQPLPCGAEGLDRGGCAAVRLLPVGPDHGGRRAARQERQSERRRDRRRDDEHLPLRDIPADPRRHPPRRAAGLTMSARTPLTRREFLETSGAASAGLRSEEHTSELQSLTNLVCRLLLEKKKKNTKDVRRTATR